MPSPVNTVTGRPSSRNFTERTVGNWVIVYTTWARRIVSEATPPPAPNSEDRSTVATPFAIDKPRRRVPVGSWVPTPPAISALVGPARSACNAAVPTAWVAGTVRWAENRVSPELNHTEREIDRGWAVCDGCAEPGVLGDEDAGDGGEEGVPTPTAPPRAHA